MKYSCIIVDDEPLSHNVLRNHLAKNADVVLQGAFFNAKEADQFLKSQTIDILLLDIQMPEINGLDFLKSLTAKPVTIVSTAYRDYALEGFEVGVIDYLLKPISLERFNVAMRRAMDFISLVKAGDTVDFERRENSYELLIKTGTKKILLDYRKIIFAQGLKDYTILHTEGKKYVVKGSVKAFEEYLPDDYFLRVHKSFIVAKPLIKIVHKSKIELDSLSIPIGRNFKNRVEGFLNRT